MIGTTYKPFRGEPGPVRAGAEDIDELVHEVNSMYSPAGLSRADVTSAHAGLVPMAAVMDDTGEDVQLVKESGVVDHGLSDPGRKGFYSISGVKYTTALRVAEEAGSKVLAYLRKADRPDAVYPCDSSGHEKESDETALREDHRYLIERYGPLVPAVMEYVRRNDEMICADPELCLGEIDYFLAEEMACTLADVVFRRCELASAECPLLETLERIARHMGTILGWDAQRIAKEISDVTEEFILS